jgi:branched-chain amino acid transport system permease protein
MLAQDIVNGLLQGGVFALVALGLSLVFGVLRLVNLAHGTLLIGGGYVAYECQRKLGLDQLESLVIVVPVVLVIAYPIQRYLLTDLMERSPDVPLVATFAVALILEGVLAEAFSSNSEALNASYATSGLSFLGLHVEVVDVIALGLALSLTLLTHWLLTRTRVGVAVRAAAADPATARTMGLDVRRIYAATFAGGAALASIGGVMIGLNSSLVPTGEDLGWLVKGFAVVVLGGIGNIGGTLVAGLALGVVEALGGRVFGSAYSDLVVYATFFIVLAIRPAGLLRRRLA